MKGKLPSPCSFPFPVEGCSGTCFGIHIAGQGWMRHVIPLLASQAIIWESNRSWAWVSSSCSLVKLDIASFKKDLNNVYVQQRPWQSWSVRESKHRPLMGILLAGISTGSANLRSPTKWCWGNFYRHCIEFSSPYCSLAAFTPRRDNPAIPFLFRLGIYLDPVTITSDSFLAVCPWEEFMEGRN